MTIDKRELKEHFAAAEKYVADELLNHVFVEQVLLSLRLADECRCPMDAAVTDPIRDLMDEYGEDNGLPEGWWNGIKSEEDIFFDIYDELDLTLD